MSKFNEYLEAVRSLKEIVRKDGSIIFAPYSLQYFKKIASDDKTVNEQEKLGNKFGVQITQKNGLTDIKWFKNKQDANIFFNKNSERVNK